MLILMIPVEFCIKKFTLPSRLVKEDFQLVGVIIFQYESSIQVLHKSCSLDANRFFFLFCIIKKNMIDSIDIY